jgi:hypothetical protein
VASALKSDLRKTVSFMYGKPLLYIDSNAFHPQARTLKKVLVSPLVSVDLAA